jgi:hypothetical protein
MPVRGHGRCRGRRRERLEHGTAAAACRGDAAATSAPGRGSPPYLDRRRRRLYQDGLDVPLLRDTSRVPRRRAEARRPGRIRPRCRQGAAANERARSSAIVKRQGQLWQTGATLFSRHCHRAHARLRTRSQRERVVSTSCDLLLLSFPLI